MLSIITILKFAFYMQYHLKHIRPASLPNGRDVYIRWKNDRPGFVTQSRSQKITDMDVLQ